MVNYTLHAPDIGRMVQNLLKKLCNMLTVLQNLLKSFSSQNVSKSRCC